MDKWSSRIVPSSLIGMRKRHQCLGKGNPAGHFSATRFLSTLLLPVLPWPPIQAASAPSRLGHRWTLLSAALQCPCHMLEDTILEGHLVLLNPPSTWLTDFPNLGCREERSSPCDRKLTVRVVRRWSLKVNQARGCSCWRQGPGMFPPSAPSSLLPCGWRAGGTRRPALGRWPGQLCCSFARASLSEDPHSIYRGAD